MRSSAQTNVQCHCTCNMYHLVKIELPSLPWSRVEVDMYKQSLDDFQGSLSSIHDPQSQVFSKHIRQLRLGGTMDGSGCRIDDSEEEKRLLFFDCGRIGIRWEHNKWRELTHLLVVAVKSSTCGLPVEESTINCSINQGLRSGLGL